MSKGPLIAVVDYGAGNLRSVAKALERSGLDAVVVSDRAAVCRADGVVLPGVGAFANAVANLRDKGLDDAVRESIEAGRPYLGLCVGLQVLFDESDEHGPIDGLGLLPGRVERFAEHDADDEPLCVPHIGWNNVRFRGSHPMLEEMPAEDCYYFVHSYKAVPARSEVAVGLADYGGDFAAAVATERLFAVQFHPEKSQSAGKKLLDAYASWVRSCV
jgi:glutamine amidotransferase